MPLGGAVRVSHAPLATTPANAPRADRAADRKQEARKQAAAAARGGAAARRAGAAGAQHDVCDESARAAVPSRGAAEPKISAAAAALALAAEGEEKQRAAPRARPGARSRLELAAGGAAMAEVEALKSRGAELEEQVATLHAELESERTRAEAAEARAQALQDELDALQGAQAAQQQQGNGQAVEERAVSVAEQAKQLADSLAGLTTGGNDGSPALDAAPSVRFAPSPATPSGGAVEPSGGDVTPSSEARLASMRRKLAELKTGRTPAGVRWNTNMAFHERTPSSARRPLRRNGPTFGSPLESESGGSDDEVSFNSNSKAAARRSASSTPAAASRPHEGDASCSPESVSLAASEASLSIGGVTAHAESTPVLESDDGGFTGFGTEAAADVFFTAHAKNTPVLESDDGGFTGFGTEAAADVDNDTPPLFGNASSASESEGSAAVVVSSDAESDASPPEGLDGATPPDSMGFSDSDFMSASKFFRAAGADDRDGLHALNEALLPNVGNSIRKLSAHKGKARNSSEDSAPKPKRISFSSPGDDSNSFAGF